MSVALLKRTLKSFQKDNLSDSAAALTYYGILALFPGLLALVSVLGLAGEGATQPLIDNLSEVAPGPAQEIFTNAIKNLQDSGGGAGIALVIGLAIAIWSASGYVAAFMRASNEIYDVDETIPMVKGITARLGTTLLLLGLVAITAIGVILSGGLAGEVGKVLGVDDSVVDAWNILKWPVLLGVVSLLLAVLYQAAPNSKQGKFRLITPGSLVAVGIWVLASVAFAVYVGNFGSYNKTYGTLGGMIVFLTWLWLSNVAVLFGAELNAELEREPASA